MRWTLSVLGAFVLEPPGGEPLRLPTRKAQALLAFLALQLGAAQPREKLAALLWGNVSPAQARTSLRQCLASLRKALGDEAGVLRGNGTVVTLEPDAFDVDATRFERLVTEGTPDTLAEAVTLYRGDLLEGIGVDEEVFEEWLRPEQARLRELALAALEKLLERQAEAGSATSAIQTGLRLLAFDPTHEPAHRALMRIQTLQGRRGAALRQYQVCVDVLRRELGVDPDPETRQLYREILQGRLRALRSTAPSPDAVSHAGDATRPAERRLDPVPPLVGRESEWAWLRSSLAEAIRGRGRSLALFGEAGVGKTRLLEELATSATAEAAHVWIGRCHESTQVLPFSPWVEALRGGWAGADRKPFALLDDVWRAELARLLPELGEPHASAALEDPLRLFAAVDQLFAAVVRDGTGVVLILEDAHWADEMSLKLLSYLARRVRSRPILLVTSAREEGLADAPLLARLLDELGREPDFARLDLGPLTRADTLDLVRTQVRAGSGVADVGQLGERVWALSEGNPFVIIETMRAVQREETPESSAIAVPERVREMVGSALGRLSARGRHLMETAAVIGRDFEFPVLRHAAALAGPDAAEGVEELVRRRVLHGVGERFDFVHDRVRQVAYDRMLSPRRKQLHATVAAAHETLHAQDLEAHSASLGLHYLRGEVWDEASTHLQRAGVRALGFSAHREAETYFEQALDAIAHLPESPAATRQAFDLRMYLEACLWARGEMEAIVANLAEAERLADALDDRRRLGHVSGLLCGCWATMGRRGRAIEAGRRALDVSEEVDDVPLQATARIFLGFAEIAGGDYPVATQHLKRAAEVLRGDLVHKRLGQVGLPAVFARAWISWPLVALGEFGEAEAHAREALEIAERAQQPYSLALAYCALGHVEVQRGEPRRALPSLERATTMCRDYGLWVLFPVAASSLGQAKVCCGRVDDAIVLLREAVDQGAAREILWCQPVRMAALGEALFAAGARDEAAEVARNALKLAIERREKGSEAHVRFLLGRMADAQEPPDLAARGTHQNAALALANELGMRPLYDRCRLELERR